MIAFQPIRLKVLDRAEARCHVCLDGGDPTAMILRIMRQEHPEWFKGKKEVTALDMGSWVRTNFKTEFQSLAERRSKEIFEKQVVRPVVRVEIEENTVHFCLDCLYRLVSLVEGDQSSAEESPANEDVGDDPIKRKPGRPKVVKRKAIDVES